ncbi:MAG: VWA domain-containing protein [Rhodoblastus sp.]|nr:VWA domain-containing protein [Rhodoblastus sp.]MCB1525211.1 VWA domain-containing protein [Rhodoblastus sp.]
MPSERSSNPFAATAPQATGKLADNILYFARALRDAGLPVGPGAVIDAINAVEAAGIGTREDFRATLHAVFVKKHEHTIIFDQAFAIFWRKRGFIEKMIALMSPQAKDHSEPKKPDAGAARVADALYKHKPQEKPKEQVEVDARFTMSASEVLQTKDFAQMSADEIAVARAAIARLRMPSEKMRLRRWKPDPHGGRIDPRGTFRKSLRSGGAIELAFRAHAERYAPIVAICDISGSMSDYTRIFLHFLHQLTDQRRRVHTFLFGTRLTNVTRALRQKDVDEALAECSAGVKDWSGGTRIGASLHAFNREWSRRVLGQGAICVLFTDGLERDHLDQLSAEMERLHKSCRRLIWVNPLLRYSEFQAKASGVRAMLPHVDEFRPIHNLRSMADLIAALAQEKNSSSTDPRKWLRAA